MNKSILHLLSILYSTAISITNGQVCQSHKISHENCIGVTNDSLPFGSNVTYTCNCFECGLSGDNAHNYPYWITASANAFEISKSPVDCCNTKCRNDVTEKCRDCEVAGVTMVLDIDRVTWDAAGEHFCIARDIDDSREEALSKPIDSFFCKIEIRVSKNPGSPKVISKNMTSYLNVVANGFLNISCRFEKPEIWKNVSVSWKLNNHSDIPRTNRTVFVPGETEAQVAYQGETETVSGTVDEVVLRLNSIRQKTDFRCVAYSPNYHKTQELRRVTVSPEPPSHPPTPNDSFPTNAIVNPSLKTTPSASLTGVLVAVISCSCLLIIAFFVYFTLKRRRRSADGRWITVVEFAQRSHQFQPVTTYWNGLPEISEGNVSFDDKLGEGYFSEVFKAWIRGSPEESTVVVAVKVAKEPEYGLAISKDVLINEAEVICSLGKHPNVVSLLGVIRHQENGLFSLVMPLATNGTLKNYLHSLRYEKTQAACSAKMLHFSFQIASGMEYLHSKKCIHRDLAARNVLVYEDDIVKVSDFGLARNKNPQDYYRKKSKNLTPFKWTAPEALVDLIYSESSDVWSYGIVCWEIVTYGGTPYPGVPEARLCELLTSSGVNYRMSRPRNCPEILYNIMTRCWAKAPSHRPRFAGIASDLQSTQSEKPVPKIMVKCSEI